MKTRIAIWIFALAVFFAPALPATAQRARKNSPPRAKTTKVDLSREMVGRESAKFLSVVGNWSIADDGGKRVLAVDGRQWLKGQPANGLAQKARAIYGARHEEFIDNVKAFAYFPYAVAREIDDFHEGEINLRFNEAGQAADENGNEHRQQGAFTRTNGQQGKVNDVWFRYE